MEEIKRLRSEGHTSAKAIARELTRRGVVTAQGKARWSATQVARVIVRGAG
jgi:hypothetical protein